MPLVSSSLSSSLPSLLPSPDTNNIYNDGDDSDDCDKLAFSLSLKCDLHDITNNDQKKSLENLKFEEVDLN